MADLEMATCFMAKASVKLFIIRNELLCHKRQQKSVQLHFNHNKWRWLFLNQWFGLLLRWLFPNYVSNPELQLVLFSNP